MDYDLMMKRSIKVTRMITEPLRPLQEMFNELKRQKQQLPTTMFCHKVKKKVSTVVDPQASSPVPDIILQSFFSSDQPSPPSGKVILMTLLPFLQKVSTKHSVRMPTPSPHFISS